MFFTIDDVVSGQQKNVNVLWISSLKNGNDEETAPNYELLIYQPDGGRPLTEVYSSAAERQARREAIMEAGKFFDIEEISYNIVFVQSISKVEAGEPMFDGNVAQKPSTAITFSSGRVLIGEFDTEAARDAFYEMITEASSGGGLVQKDTFADLPEKGNQGTLYVTKDTGTFYYWDNSTKTYISQGESGRAGIYYYNNELPNNAGSEAEVKKSDLTEIFKPTKAYQEGSEVVGSNSVHGVIIKVLSNAVIVRTLTDSTSESFKEVGTESELPNPGLKNILYYVKDVREFKIWDVDKNEYVDPIHTIIVGDAPVKDAKTDTLYVDEKSIKYTSDNEVWHYLASEAEQYKTGTEYYKGMILYFNNVLVKVLEDFTSDDKEIDTLRSFAKDIEDEKLEKVIDGAVTTNTQYDITVQMDGVKQVFDIDASITASKSVLVFYAGQLLVEGVNYTIDYVNHRLMTLFPEAPSSSEDRHMVIITGDIGTPTVVRSVQGSEDGLVDNSDPSNPRIKHDDTKIDKSISDYVETSTDVELKNNNVEITTTSTNTDDGSTVDDKIVLKSEDGNTKFNVNKKDDHTTEVSISTIGNTTVIENAILFDGDKDQFTLPNEVDLDRPILVIVNGVVLTAGEDNDYVIDSQDIKFALVFERGSNNIIINFK